MSRRAAATTALVLLLQAGAVRADDEPGVAPPPDEEPALARPPAPGTSGFFRRAERGPRLKVGYRTFSVAEMGDRSARYHCFDAHYYIFSGLFRAATGFEGSYEDTPRSSFILALNLAAGVQYPSRITPFLDFIFGAGAYRRDIVETDLVGFTYQFGIEAGTEVFIAGGVFVSAALGWRRQTFRYGGNDQVETVLVYFDSLTVKVGLGF
jgi:hypothetical protein